MRQPPTKRPRRSFEKTAQILRLFVERWSRPPGAREWVDVDGERIMIGPWLCKARAGANAGRLSEEQDRLMAEILQADWNGCAPE